jgi:threonine dehydratase
MTVKPSPALDAVLDLLPGAREIVATHLNRTEVRDLGWLHRYTEGRDVVAKLETSQVTGSFKPRGALVALSALESRPTSSSRRTPARSNASAFSAWAPE